MDYVKSLEEQNEELKERLTNLEDAVVNHTPQWNRPPRSYDVWHYKNSYFVYAAVGMVGGENAGGMPKYTFTIHYCNNFKNVTSIVSAMSGDDAWEVVKKEIETYIKSGNLITYQDANFTNWINSV